MMPGKGGKSTNEEGSSGGEGGGLDGPKKPKWVLEVKAKKGVGKKGKPGRTSTEPGPKNQGGMKDHKKYYP